MKNSLFGYLDVTSKHTIFYIDEREFKLCEKLKKTFQNPDIEGNGNRLRQIVNMIAKRFKNNPEQLQNFMRGDFLSAYHPNSYHSKNKNCFDEIDSKIKELYRSAYIMNTGDFSCLKDSKYAGFAITLTSSPKKLHTSYDMFMFAKLSGDALSYSHNSGNSLFKSVNKGNSLRKSRNYEFSLGFSRNFENSLQSSKNSFLALEYSINYGNSLRNSKNFGFVLKNSKNLENALQYSKNYEHSLQAAYFSGNSLNNAKIQKNIDT